MRAGRMRHRLKLQQATRTQDSHGGFSTTWTTVATVWGWVEVQRSKQDEEADQEVGVTASKAGIRFAALWSGIDTTWRVQDATSGKNYQIVGVKPGDEMTPYRRSIELDLIQGQPDNES